MGIVRSSFLIDEQGVIEKVSFKVKPILTQRSCWVSKKYVSVVISGDEIMYNKLRKLKRA